MIKDIFDDNLVDSTYDIEKIVEDEDEIREDDEQGSGNEAEPKVQDEKDNYKPKIKRKGGPRPVLNAQRLMGPRGLGAIKQYFRGIKFQGRGKEKEDLNAIMIRLELWAHRLYPRGQFTDTLKKIAKLGEKKEIVNYMKRLRLGLEDVRDDHEHPRDRDGRDDREDPFNQLLPATAPPVSANTEMTAEQREIILQNRLIAEERRAARIKRAQELKEKFKAQQNANKKVMSKEILLQDEKKERVTVQEADSTTIDDLPKEKKNNKEKYKSIRF